MIEYENLHKLNQPFVDDYKHQLDDVLKSGWFILGKQVSEFENQFARYCGSTFCVGVANGLDALTLALRSFSFKAGSEVIVPSNTYIATILSILNCGLTPVMVEPDMHSYNIDPTRIGENITKKTVAIMAVHLYGKCCSMDEICQLASKHKLKLIEDCAQAHGAQFRGKKAGTFGDFGAFSFYPTKNLGALGDGGCLTTDREDLRKTTRLLRNYGSEAKYYNELIGVNSRLDELQAAFLSVKLKSLDRINNHKRMLAGIYSKELREDFVKPAVHDDYHDVYHIYNVRHPQRDKLKEYLLHHEIMTEIHYPVPPHQQKAMKGIFGTQSYPISEEIHSTTLSLPISYFHSLEDVGRVVDVMNKF